jgi:hypothetical protein
VADARLVLDPYQAESAAKQLLDQVVFLVIKRRAAERTDTKRVVNCRAVRQLLHERVVTVRLMSDAIRSIAQSSGLGSQWSEPGAR